MCDWERRSVYCESRTCRSYSSTGDGGREIRPTKLQGIVCTLQSSEEESTVYRRTTTPHYINMVRSHKRKRVEKVFDIVSQMLPWCVLIAMVLGGLIV